MYLVMNESRRAFQVACSSVTQRPALLILMFSSSYKGDHSIFGSDRSSRNANLRPFFCPCGPNLSEALNLHLLTS